MPNAMRNRSRDEEKLTAEFTTGQLVVAICFFLFFALTCFLLGILVGKYQGYPEQTIEQMAARETQQSPTTPEPKPEATPAATPTASGTQAAPRSDLLPRRNEGAATSTPSRYTPRDQRGGPRVTELPPLPAPPAPLSPAQPPLRVTRPASPTTTSPSPPASAASAPAAPSATAAAATATPPAPAAPAEEKPAPPLLTPSSPPPGPPAAYTPDFELEPAAAVAAAANASVTPASAGRFAIQLAAFMGDDRKQRAESYLSDVKKGDTSNAEIAVSEDGQYHRVVIAGFPDRAAAQAACDTLKKKKGFEGVFVRPIP